MTNKEPVSHHKTITLIVFLCAAIMASVFVYHAKQTSNPTIYANDKASIFAVSREIKPFELVTQNGQTFSQKNLNDHWTLLFFGFTHCSNVCPTTLEMMNRSYAKLHDFYPNLQIVLVSLDPDRDTPDAVSKYAQSFNQAFIGSTGKLNELRKLQSQFGIYAAREGTGNDYQLQHTSSIMLIDPKGKWAGLFNYGMKPETFINTFDESVKAFSQS